MKKTVLFTFAFAILKFVSFSQNIVVNNSLEQYNPCPISISEFDVVTNWNNPSEATPDYYNACAFPFPFPFPSVNVPDNLLGYQPARTGVGYGGLIAYEDFPLGCPSGISTSWREYLQGRFTTPMVAGQSYCIKFYVSLADDVRYCVEDMGAYISQNQVSIFDSVALPFTPQIVNSSGALCDTLNWVLIKGTYVAQGGEQYIIIGNFNNDANTTPTCFNSSITTFQNSYGYYYVDDVSIEASNNCCMVMLTDDTEDETCIGNNGSAEVFADGVSPYSYVWDIGGNTSSQSGLSAGIYSVTVTDNSGCVEERRIEVFLNDNLNVLSSVQTASCGSCDGAATANPLNGQAPFLYQWDANANNQTTQTATGLCAGTFEVTVTDNNGCTGTAQVALSGGGNVLTAVITPVDVSCPGQCDGSATIPPAGATPPYSYQWDANASGQITQTALNLCAGTYNVTTTDAGGNLTVVFWTENFGTGCNQGNQASSYTGGPNGAWTVSNTGTNDVGTNNDFFVSATEAGMGAGNCGSGCLDNSNLTDRTLHVGNYSGSPNAILFCPFGDCGAAYDGGGIEVLGCGFFGIPCARTNRRAESPSINCSGHSNIILEFEYIENGEGSNDNATLWYFNGSGWSLLVDLPKTLCCGGSPCGLGGQGLWTAYSINLPASANNNSNVKIGFNWTNNDADGTAADPSFAVDNIQLSEELPGQTCSIVSTVIIEEQDGILTATSSNNASCANGNDGSIDLSVSGGGGGLSYLWSNNATIQDLSNVAPGTYSVTVTDVAGCEAIDSATVGLGFISGTPGTWTWTGVVDTDWFEACNWDKVTVPDSLAVVIIPGGTPFNPTISGNTAFCKDITIYDNNGGHLTTDVGGGGFLEKRP